MSKIYSHETLHTKEEINLKISEESVMSINENDTKPENIKKRAPELAKEYIKKMNDYLIVNLPNCPEISLSESTIVHNLLNYVNKNTKQKKKDKMIDMWIRDFNKLILIHKDDKIKTQVNHFKFDKNSAQFHEEGTKFVNGKLVKKEEKVRIVSGAMETGEKINTANLQGTVLILHEIIPTEIPENGVINSTNKDNYKKNKFYLHDGNLEGIKHGAVLMNMILRQKIKIITINSFLEVKMRESQSFKNINNNNMYIKLLKEISCENLKTKDGINKVLSNLGTSIIFYFAVHPNTQTEINNADDHKVIKLMLNSSAVFDSNITVGYFGSYTNLVNLIEPNLRTFSKNGLYPEKKADMLNKLLELRKKIFDIIVQKVEENPEINVRVICCKRNGCAEEGTRFLSVTGNETICPRCNKTICQRCGDFHEGECNMNEEEYFDYLCAKNPHKYTKCPCKITIKIPSLEKDDEKNDEKDDGKNDEKDERRIETCNVKIFRLYGCAHITCKNCEGHFCMACRQEYEGTNQYCTNPKCQACGILGYSFKDYV